MATTSFLSKIGTAFKDVFAFLGSPKGQAVVAATEGVAETVATAVGAGVPVQGALALINSWGSEIIKTEALAAAAGQQTGSGLQKAAAVLTAITPQATAFAASQGAPAPTLAALTTINTSLVTAFNTLTAAAPHA